jgi:hypothetical protein
LNSAIVRRVSISQPACLVGNLLAAAFSHRIQIHSPEEGSWNFFLAPFSFSPFFSLFIH